ncbi:DUF535 family protein [Sulfuricurvum sp.]|uniref:VirK/YbjX family protein n=1 Tax=Sulfuricurvum sp. TaxID=2025608 RepID=UPI0026042710|nr:DUF535 family protein [Sulfuricurvum sp.]MDD3594890.1 DUF535 family protein [Sulfuricurvum sp.]
MYQHYQHAKTHLKTRNSQIEFLSLSMLHYVASKKIFNFFEQPVFSPFATAYPMLQRKILHRYLHCGMSVNKKANAIIDHYTFINKHFTSESIEHMYFGGSIHLLQVTVASELYTLEIGYSEAFYREGELALMLIDTENRRIYSIAFSFLKDKDEHYILIGGMQGPQQTDASSLELIKTMTKEMHGLRPRNFMIFILRIIAASLGIEKITAITTDNHISKCHRVAFKRFDPFQADYNGYFEEEGGIRKGRFYILQTEQKRKSIDSIESKKRSLYKKRYTMMDNLSHIVHTKLKSMCDVTNIGDSI